MQNTLSIRYAFCACAQGVLCYLEPSIVFKAKVARHVRITIISWDYVGNVTIPTQVIKHSHFYPSRRISQPDCSIHIKLIYIGIHFRITSFRTKLDNYIIKSKSTCTTFSLYLIAFISRQSSQTTTCSGNVDMDVNILLCTLMTIQRHANVESGFIRQHIVRYMSLAALALVDFRKIIFHRWSDSGQY